jgi:hypothetical protein
LPIFGLGEEEETFTRRNVWHCEDDK